MSSDEHDLSDEQPTPRADPIINRMSIRAPGLWFGSEMTSPSSGPAAVAIATTMIAIAGTVAAVAVGGFTTFVGANPTIVSALMGAVFLVVVLPGLYLVSRDPTTRKKRRTRGPR